MVDWVPYRQLFDEGNGYGANDFARVARENGLNGARAREYAEQQTRNQIAKEAKRPKEYSRIWAPRVMNQVQVDILYLLRPPKDIERKKGFTTDVAAFYGGNKYALILVDVKSRMIFGRLLRGRNLDDEIVPALQSIVAQIRRESPFGPPMRINADQEFNKEAVRQYLYTIGIEDHEMYFSNPRQSNKNVIVERANRTIRNKLQRKNRNAYFENFPRTFESIIDSLNESMNYAATGETPENVYLGKRDSRQGEPKANVGERAGARFRRRFGRQGGRVPVFQVRSNWQVGQFVRPRKRVYDNTQTRFYASKNNVRDKFEDKIYQIAEKVGQVYYLRPLLPGGRLGVDPYNIPYRGYELLGVTPLNEDLAEWLRERDNPADEEEDGDDDYPPQPPLPPPPQGNRARRLQIEREQPEQIVQRVLRPAEVRRPPARYRN